MLCCGNRATTLRELDMIFTKFDHALEKVQKYDRRHFRDPTVLAECLAAKAEKHII